MSLKTTCKYFEMTLECTPNLLNMNRFDQNGQAQNLYWYQIDWHQIPNHFNLKLQRQLEVKNLRIYTDYFLYNFAKKITYGVTGLLQRSVRAVNERFRLYKNESSEIENKTKTNKSENQNVNFVKCDVRAFFNDLHT